MNKIISTGPSLIAFFAAIVFGLPVLYTALYHPVSRMASEAPLYKELSKNSFMVMSVSIDLARGRLIRYTDANGKAQITRMIGLPGDEVRFEGHRLSVNGNVIDDYKNISLPDSRFIVPKEVVFGFPDYFPENSSVSSLDGYAIPVNAITGTILYTFDNATSGDKQPLLSVYGGVLMVLYFFVYFALGKYKEFIYKPIYYPARISIALNLAILSLIGLYGMLFDSSALIAVIYYLFISWLTFLGLSISGASISLLLIGGFGVLAMFSDMTVTTKDMTSQN